VVPTTLFSAHNHRDMKTTITNQSISPKLF
jgi:hypothetical protein